MIDIVDMDTDLCGYTLHDNAWLGWITTNKQNKTTVESAQRFCVMYYIVFEYDDSIYDSQ